MPWRTRCRATVREILAIPGAQRSPAQTRAVFSLLAHHGAGVARGERRHRGSVAQHPEGSLQLVMADARERRSSVDPHPQARRLPAAGSRGAAGTPAFLHPLRAEREPDRLRFARWLVDRQSPTTARSLVNRVWQAYFGTGIVATAENFGTQCEPPSNQALLDWLAVEFMDSGWSLKKLQRTIVTSAAYRQSSQVLAGAVVRRIRTTG